MKLLDLDGVQEITHNILSSLEKRNTLGLDNIKQNFYWKIDCVEAFSMTTDAKVIVGDLNDDIEELKKLKTGVDWVTPCDLERLAALFMYLAKKVEEKE